MRADLVNLPNRMPEASPRLHPLKVDIRAGHYVTIIYLLGAPLPDILKSA